jgi:hypothetical protein
MMHGVGPVPQLDPALEALVVGATVEAAQGRHSNLPAFLAAQ